MQWNMLAASSILHSIVPITRFNRGEANKIFEEVENSGMKIVVKNNKPTCVLLSTKQYEELMELLSDQLMLQEAEKRMVQTDTEDTCTQAEMMAELGISQEELDEIQVEIEE